MPVPFTHGQQPVAPALYLYPLNDSFVPKHIALLPQQRVKIGRQTNAKTVPGERNGYFDSKVLSRQHAEVWEQDGKIYIKDVKSSNGTFINGERLSGEGLESEPFELKSDDIVEFGIDIVGEDNKTIIHHKVAARVLCVLSEQDAQAAAQAEQQQLAQNPPGYALSTHHQNIATAGPSNAFNFNGQGPAVAGQRRPAMQPQGLVGMGGMGGSMRPPGKSGLTFDHILSRLQGELQKSRETGAELHSLNGSMNEIHDTLGGTLPTNLPPYPQTLPPVMPPQPAPEPSTSSVPPAAIGELQSQLRETQSSLAGYTDKFQVLESILSEHDGFKHDIELIKQFMEERKRETQAREHRHNEEFSADDDDARSVATVVPQEMGRVDEEDEEAAAEHEDRRRSSREVGRPRTPEPSLVEFDEDDHHRSKSRSYIPEDIIHRLETLSSQLESALDLSRTLQAQQVTAQNTIQLLESKVAELQQLVQATQTRVDGQHEAHQAAIKEAIESVRIPEQEREKERESLTEMINEWKKGVEGKWSSVQEEWSAEKDRLRRARDEWELKTKSIEDGILARVESRLSAIQRDGHPFINGPAKPNGQGLVTPPSPRSLSSDSMRPRSRKKRNGSSRGRAKSPSQTATPPANTDSDEDDEPVLGSNDGAATSPRSRPRSPWTTDESSDSETHPDNTESSRLNLTSIKENTAIQYPITPESSLVCAKEEPPRLDSTVIGPDGLPKDLFVARYTTALGVVILSVAAAAVLWRVKPE